MRNPVPQAQAPGHLFAATYPEPGKLAQQRDDVIDNVMYRASALQLFQSSSSESLAHDVAALGHRSRIKPYHHATKARHRAGFLCAHKNLFSVVLTKLYDKE